MKRLVLNLIAVAAVAGLFGGCATTVPPVAGDYRLPAPQLEAERSYLGLPSGALTFQLEEIRCEILVIDCFDMYCHVCQIGAKHVNELFQLTLDRGLGSRIKVIGLGVGDSPLEVATYKEKLKVPFPVFADRRALLVKRFGEPKLPNLLVLRNQAGRLEVIHRSPGVLLSPTKLLSQIEADLTQAGSRGWNDSAQAAQPTCEAGSTACRERGGSRTAPISSAPNAR